MTDLIGIFGGAFRADADQPPPPEDQLRSALLAAGLTPPATIHLDGKLRRFNAGTKGRPGAGDKSGYYIAYGDGIPAGTFGCWRAGIQHNWRADVGRELTPAEEMAHARRLAEAKALRDAELAESRERVAQTVEGIWSAGLAADPDHPYLARKGIRPHGARVTGDGRLMVPLYSDDGEISSIQYISADGDKRYHPGGATGGKFWTLGLPGSGTTYIAEGFATAATIHEVTGQHTVVAYSASNLVPVTGQWRERLGAMADIVIVADNDASQVGLRYAEQAAAKHGARVILPPEQGDANDYRQAGGDLLALLTPASTGWLMPAEDFSREPAPLRWLIKRWIQADATIMVHGPSGGGKTFCVLDWCLSIASGRSDWHGHLVRPGAVVYLAGEGHHGLKGRIAAWRQVHQPARMDMWISSSGCDLNTSVGYQQAITDISALSVTPQLIVIDTLHRFLAGDENSAQDAKTMLDACAALQRKFGCTVLLVHHTGVSDEAQHRARGSSAWRGALDIEISVVPAKPGRPIELIQRKAKDSELAPPVWLELSSITLDGWLDEDGDPVTSAVVTAAEAPEETTSDGKRLAKFRKQFEDAWQHAGRDELDGFAYVSRAGLRAYLEAAIPGKADKTYRNMMSTGCPGKLVTELMEAAAIRETADGFILCDEHFMRIKGLLHDSE